MVESLCHGLDGVPGLDESLVIVVVLGDGHHSAQQLLDVWHAQVLHDVMLPVHHEGNPPQSLVDDLLAGVQNVAADADQTVFSDAGPQFEHEENVGLAHQFAGELVGKSDAGLHEVGRVNGTELQVEGECFLIRLHQYFAI